MNPAMKVAAGVAGGYLLGRHRKMRYAVGFGAALLGKRLELNPTKLVLTGVKSLRELPEVMELSDTVRGELTESGRRAAMTLMSSRLDSLSDGLRDRSRALEAGGTASDDDEPLDHDDVYPDEDNADRADEIDLRDDRDREDAEYEDEDDAAYDEADDDEPVDEEDMDDEPAEPRRRARRRAGANA